MANLLVPQKFGWQRSECLLEFEWHLHLHQKEIALELRLIRAQIADVFYVLGAERVPVLFLVLFQEVIFLPGLLVKLGQIFQGAAQLLHILLTFVLEKSGLETLIEIDDMQSGDFLKYLDGRFQGPDHYGAALKLLPDLTGSVEQEFVHLVKTPEFSRNCGRDKSRVLEIEIHNIINEIVQGHFQHLGWPDQFRL